LDYEKGEKDRQDMKSIIMNKNGIIENQESMVRSKINEIDKLN